MKMEKKQKKTYQTAVQTSNIRMKEVKERDGSCRRINDYLRTLTTRFHVTLRPLPTCLTQNRGKPLDTYQKMSSYLIQFLPTLFLLQQGYWLHSLASISGVFWELKNAATANFRFHMTPPPKTFNKKISRTHTTVRIFTHLNNSKKPPHETHSTVISNRLKWKIVYKYLS